MSAGTAWNTVAFIQSIQLIHESTMDNDRALRDIAATIAAENAEALSHQAEFSDLLQKNGEVAYDILKATFRLKMKDEKIDGTLACPKCSSNRNTSVDDDFWGFKSGSRRR